MTEARRNALGASADAGSTPLESTEPSLTDSPSTLVDGGVPRKRNEPPRVSRPRLLVALHALLPVLIGALWGFTVRDVPLRDMTDLGLISVLPASTLVLLFALAASFSFSLMRRPLRPLVPLMHVLVLVVLLYGLTAFIEPEARFSSAYRHVGIIDYIAQNHSLDTSIDAYFSWPGFFVLGVLIADVAGFSSPLALAPWGPLAFNLLFLPPLVVIFRWASSDPRVTWAGLWAFYSTNWVGQDYIAPQALGYLLWLTILGALLTTWTPKPAWLSSAATPRKVLRSLRPREIQARMRKRSEDGAPALSGQRVGLFLLVVLVYGATVTGHQLTPVAAVVTVTGLVLFAGLETRRLPMIMVVLLAAWISYMTTQYLIGHIDTLAGPVGSVGENLNQNVTSRVQGSPDHQLIVNARLAATAAIWGLAFLGFARRLRARRADVAMAVIGAGPFLLPALQPYGGEMLLRVFLFSLPAVSFFIACLAFPTPAAGRTWPTMALTAVVGCSLLGAFQFTRHGNERQDHFTTGDAAAVRALYRAAPKGSQLFAGSENLPWKYRDYASYEYRSINRLEAWQRTSTPDPRQLVREIQQESEESGKKGSFVIVTRSTKIGAELLLGRPRALEALVDTLRVLPSTRQVYRGRDGDVFFIPSPSRAERTSKRRRAERTSKRRAERTSKRR